MNKCNSLIKYIRFAKATYIRADESDTVVNIVKKYFDGKPSDEYIQSLIKAGCVYYREPISNCKTTPPNPYRIFQNNLLERDSILKLFLYPRPWSIDHITSIDPAKYILFENEYFMVVDKPHGLDVGPILDNYHGNITTIIKTFIEKRDGREYKLFNPHRIDSPTRGLIVIIKDQSYLRKFNKILIDNQVSKIYKVFLPKYGASGCNGSGSVIKPGIYKHYMSPNEILPKVLVDEKIEKYYECLLEVLKVEEKQVTVPIDLDEVSLDLLQIPIAFNEIGTGDFRKQMKSISFNVVDVKLITGRTHQIRAQFSKMGYPLFGDILYGGKNILDYDYTQNDNVNNIFNNSNGNSNSNSNHSHNNNNKNNNNNNNNNNNSNGSIRKQNQNLGKMIGLISNQLSFKCPITDVDHNFALKENNYNVNKIKIK